LLAGLAPLRRRFKCHGNFVECAAFAGSETGFAKLIIEALGYAVGGAKLRYRVARARHHALSDAILDLGAARTLPGIALGLQNLDIRLFFATVASV
jgi:hypothetical protein